MNSSGERRCWGLGWGWGGGGGEDETEAASLSKSKDCVRASRWRTSLEEGEEDRSINMRTGEDRKSSSS